MSTDDVGRRGSGEGNSAVASTPSSEKIVHSGKHVMAAVQTAVLILVRFFLFFLHDVTALDPKHGQIGHKIYQRSERPWLLITKAFQMTVKFLHD